MPHRARRARASARSSREASRAAPLRRDRRWRRERIFGGPTLEAPPVYRQQQWRSAPDSEPQVPLMPSLPRVRPPLLHSARPRSAQPFRPVPLLALPVPLAKELTRPHSAAPPLAAGAAAQAATLGRAAHSPGADQSEPARPTAAVSPDGRGRSPSRHSDRRAEPAPSTRRAAPRPRRSRWGCGGKPTSKP